MPTMTLPGFIAFPILMTINGVIALCCWWIIRKNWSQLHKPRLSGWARLQARFGIVVMTLPFVAFSLGFIYFMIQFLKAL